MKKRLPILLLLAAIGGGYWYWRNMQAAEDGSRILVSGNLEITEVDLSFKTPGRLVALNVREGDTVHAGDVIARLDAAQLEQQRARDEAAVGVARSQYQQLQTAIEYQQAQIDSELALRRAEAQQAQAQLDDLLAGSRPQEIQQAQAAVSDATAWHDAAQQEWDRAEMLFAREDISRSQYDQARAKLDSTEAQLRQARERLALVEEGPRAEVIAAARAQVERSKAAITAVEANRIELRRKQEELSGRRSDIARANAQVGITDALLDDTTLVSPIDGIVLVKAAEAGEVIAAGTSIVSIGDLAHPWLRAYINETDLGRIKIGGQVKLRTDTFPDKTYDGRISFIASEAEFTPKQIQTQEERVKLVYRIKIEVDNAHQELKNNMPVDGELIL